ncbi:LRR receptor-like serine/threonine-protein kinase GSO1 [Durio zibethinus]|uniref:LRR receptor-like serine/threonine-protein kinase GSO1 n=1 Tax=Durio zibethinus TaxID=66656 RepID=A0A6P5YA83_DURZI|nr:LRR receptor-like serine/threonine-protein kinase GSO1 [Durio zibethinus]
MLDFSRNRLSGSIPPELGKLENQQILRVSSNRLTGSIPSELGHCKKIIKLNLSANYLSGSIPSEILSLPKLQNLQLQENKLIGRIPDSFSSLQSLFELQLGGNILQGLIPCSLSNLHHFSSVLNLSNNRLSGEIPACLGKQDKLQILISQATVSLEHRKGNSSGRVLAGVTIAVVVSVALLCAMIYVLVVRHLQKKHSFDQTLRRERQSRTEDLPENMKIEDIIRATEGCSDMHIIGRGKHGTVYRTESSNSRNHWAVKKRWTWIIVTEFMPGGTLFDVLHESQPHLVLNWDRRYNSWPFLPSPRLRATDYPDTSSQTT